MPRVPTTALVRRVAKTYTPYYQKRGISISPEVAESQFRAYDLHWNPQVDRSM